MCKCCSDGRKTSLSRIAPLYRYRQLNTSTIKNRYPLPLFDTMLKRIRGAKKYVKLDIQAAFNCLRIKAGQEYLTAFITPFGLFESLVVPFGMCNAPASWQVYINKILGDLYSTIPVSPSWTASQSGVTQTRRSGNDFPCLLGAQRVDFIPATASPGE